MRRKLKVIVGLWIIGLFLQSNVIFGFDIKFTNSGISINVNAMGNFELSYPKLILKDKQELKPIEVKISGNDAILKYNSDIGLRLEKKSNNIIMNFENSSNIEKYRMDMLIPFNFRDGGRWKAGNQEGIFPNKKPEKPQFYQGNSNTLEITSDTGKTISIKIPEWSYQQLQDNREWGWNIYHYCFFAPFNKDNPKGVITIKEGSFTSGNDTKNTNQSKIKVDKFGQPALKNFPGKINSEEELKKDAEIESSYFNSLSLNGLNLDKFGGLEKSGEKFALQKTGFFHVEKKGEKWILVDPEGNAFFHLGICSFNAGNEDSTYIEGREDIYEWIPSVDDPFFASARLEDGWWKPRAISFYKANVARKYGAPFNHKDHTKRLVDRVRKIGFNSVGAFSQHSDIFENENFPYVSHLPLNLPEIPGLRGVFDPFDEMNKKKIDENFSKYIAPKADNPLIIGYFLANEQGWEDLPRAIPALGAKYHSKQHLVKMLKDKYKDIKTLNEAWQVNFDSFDALYDKGLPISTKAAFQDMQKFNEIFLEEYYKVITDTFRKYDKNHMLLGNRWQPGTSNNETLCRIAGKYMDIISINYYTMGIDEGFIKRIYEWTGEKPQFWSEFYYTSEEESPVSGSGNDMKTQKERGLAYRNYVEGAAALGFVVGIEWFTMIDQATTGRFFEKYNGERNNTGLFSVTDRPYKDMIAEMIKTHSNIYNVWLLNKKPYTIEDPRFYTSAKAQKRKVQAGHATGEMKIDGNLDNWPTRPPERISKDRIVLGKELDNFDATFKVAWDEDNLYIIVNVTDSTPMKNDLNGEHLWSADAIEIFIGYEKPETKGPLLFSDRQILIGAGKNDQFHVVNLNPQPKITSTVVPSVDGKGYTIEAAIPWDVIGIKAKEGQEYLFDIGVDNSNDGKGRSCQIMWSGIARNSSDRSAWGTLKLVR